MSDSGKSPDARDDELSTGASNTKNASSDDEFGDFTDALASWRAMEPSVGFAEAVVAARGRSVVPTVESKVRIAWSRQWGAVAVVAAVVGVLLFALRRQSPPAVTGATTATLREQVEIGHRGVAVLESGARIEWRIDRSGNTRVHQASGDVFYRVNHGGRFAVATDLGTVWVTGTCFRLAQSASVPLALDVFEGTVSFARNEGSKRLVEVGQHLEIDGLGALHVSTRGAVSDGEPSPP